MSLRVGVVVSSEYDGGAEEYVRRLYRGLADAGSVRGHLLGHVAGWEGLGLESTETGLGPKWTFRRPGRVLRTAWRDHRSALATIEAEHRREPFDAFHLMFKREQLLLTRALSRLAPVVWTEHGHLPRGPGRGLVRFAYRLASRSVARLVCVSAATEADVRRTCGEAVHTVVIENAVDDQQFRPGDDEERAAIRRELGLPADVLIAVTVSRLHPHKRVERAIAAAEGVPLVVVGDGPERARLESMAAPGGAVTFVGWLDDPAPVFRAADVGIMCIAPREGFPIVVMEAAASGCAVVGFDGDVNNSEIVAAGGLLLGEGERLVDTDIATTLAGRQRTARAWASDHGYGPWVERHREVFSHTVDEHR